MCREKNTSSDGYTTGCGMQCSNRSDLPSRVGMNPRRFPEADHSHGCVTDGLITVPDDHQLNGEVKILIVVITNTTYGIDSNVRRRLTPSAMFQRPSMWDHDMLRTKRWYQKHCKSVCMPECEANRKALNLMYVSKMDVKENTARDPTGIWKLHDTQLLAQIMAARDKFRRPRRNEVATIVQKLVYCGSEEERERNSCKLRKLT
ncbi:hypothetical protein Tco_0262190 [Tanacetum coccineum]